MVYTSISRARAGDCRGGESWGATTKTEARPAGHEVRHARGTWRSAITLVIATLVVGAGLTWWAARAENERMRSEFVASARLVERAVDWHCIRDLAGSEADLLSEDYRHLKDQLGLLCSANPRYRFIYLMGQRPDRTVFFLVDSEPPASRDYSPPGQEYTEAPASFVGAFSTGREAVAGPFSDRWGTWVSALVPYSDPKTHQVVAVLGLDIDARGWKREVAQACFPPAATTFLILGLMVAFFAVRRQSELARANSETFLNSFDDFFFVLDETCHILYMNHTAVSRLGYTNEELFNQPVSSVHPPERREEAGGIVEAMIAGRTTSCSVPLMTKSGRLTPVETRVTRGRWNGKPALFGVSKDLSRIEQSEERFAMAFNSSAVLMAISTIGEGRLLHVNDLACETLGFSRAEVIGRTPAELGIILDAQQRVALIRMVRKGRRVRSYEVSFQTKTGSIRYGLLSADVINFGDRPCWMTVMTDITDRKLAEEALRESESGYRVLFEKTANPILVVGISGDIIEMNAVAKSLFERPLQAGQLMNLRDLLPCTEATAMLHENTPLWQKGGALEVELHSGPAVKTLNLVFSPATLRGQPVALVVGTDVSDRKRLAEMTRWAELERERRRSAGTLAHLTQGVADEVRNPLFTINVDAAAETVATQTPRFAPHARHLREHASRLESLTRGILELGRGASAEESSDCQLKDLLGSALLEVENLVPSARGRILVRSYGDPLFVRAVPFRVQAVFCQLILNALQNSPPAARVWVRIGQAEREAFVEVADEGFGISERVWNRLFEPFVTTHTGRQGLGLALAKQYVAASGGVIEARKNDPSPGATFTVRLPLEGGQG